jgi:hypothetical protein
LLETNDIEQCYKDVLELVKMINCSGKYSEECDECNLCHLIDLGNIPSLITIDPVGNNIKKDQVLDMMERFKSKPIYSKFNTYIIRKCDYFNQSSANTLLKFLEEPEDDIIGFFITNNKMNVISTIRSRCQEWSMFYKEDLGNNYSDESISQFNEYLVNVCGKDDAFIYNQNVFKKLFEDRLEWSDFFTEVMHYLIDVSSNNVTLGNNDVLAKMDKREIIKIISKIEDILKYLKSNGNIELILDKFAIEMRNIYE